MKGPSESVRSVKCFFEMWPVRAASDAKLAEQSIHEHSVVPLKQCAALMCFLRSALEANEAEHMFEHGMIHWQIFELDEAVSGMVVS